MNKQSLSYENNENQAWNDDPFDLNGKFDQGVVQMSTERALYTLIEDLVSQYAKYRDDEFSLSIDRLSVSDQNEILRLYIDLTGRELTECVNGDDFSFDNEYNSSLLAMLANDCTFTRERFAEVTRKNILTYYKPQLQKMLDDQCDMHLNNMHENRGYCMRQDREYGDFSWDRL